MSTLQAVAVRATFANGFDPHSIMVDNNHSARSLPHHVAVIMDGNGRWARERGEDRVFGHAHGVESVRAMVRAARELGVGYLTLYAFSTENWARPQAEINALMTLLVESLSGEVDDLVAKGVRLRSMGAIDSLPPSCRQALQDVEDKTSKCTGLTLVLALSYSGRWELTQAVQNIVRSGIAADAIDEDTVLDYDAAEPATIHFAHEMRRGKNRSYRVDIGFERIEDGREVYGLIRSVQTGRAKDADPE